MNSSPWVVGRHESCNIRIDNVGVSRRHCQFTCENGNYFVEDLGSSNGTFVKGQKITKVPIENGTEVVIGKYALIFEDLGVDLMPVGGGASGCKAAPAGAPAEVLKTFQMDPATLKQQIAKASAGAAAVSAGVVKKAADLAKAFDPDAPLEIKGTEDHGSLLSKVIKLGALIVAATLAILVIYLVVF